MGDVRKKYRVYRLISREKIFSWRLMLEKNLTPLCLREPWVWEIFFFTPTKSHIPRLKSQMVGLLDPIGFY